MYIKTVRWCKDNDYISHHQTNSVIFLFLEIFLPRGNRKAHLPPIEIHQLHSLLSLEYEVEVADAAYGLLYLSIHRCPVFPTSGVANLYLGNLLTLDTVEMKFHHSTANAA